MIYLKLYRRENLWENNSSEVIMNNKKDPLDWLYKVREQNYERTKNMSPKEYIEYIKKRAEGIKKNTYNSKPKITYSTR